MDPDGGGWATDPQDTRERTCEWDLPPAFGVRHRLRVARSPEPGAVTVTRTHEATVEWTTDADLPAWLRAVADVLTPYGRDRTDGSTPGQRSSGTAPTDDGRFRAAPVDATVRPPDGSDPGLSDPYHYWNTPLARLRADDHYPAGVTSVTIDLVDGPDAVWTGDSAVGATVRALDGGFDPGDHSRVGLEFTGRERFRRATADGNRDGTGATTWRPVGEATELDPGGFAGLVEATLAPAVRTRLDREELDGAIAAVIDRVEAVWRAFRVEGDEPYEIPERAVGAATDPAAGR